MQKVHVKLFVVLQMSLLASRSIVAIPGARNCRQLQIKKGKIRGMESLGMICSLAELGLPDSIIPKEFADGIQILPEDAVPGDSIFPYLDLDNEIIELSITPNRADALSNAWCGT